MASNEKINNDIKKMIEWAKAMKEGGFYTKGTADNRISSLRKITAVMTDKEPKDAKSILDGLDTIVQRWATKTNASPKLVPITKSHVKRFIEDYQKYQKEPSSFKPVRRGGMVEKEKKKVTPPLKKKGKPKIENESKTQYTPSDIEPPTVSINIQIHISADASEKQIERIFESMAKHIYNK